MTFHNPASSFGTVGSLWSTNFWRTTFWTNESPRFAPWNGLLFEIIPPVLSSSDLWVILVALDQWEASIFPLNGQLYTIMPPFFLLIINSGRDLYSVQCQFRPMRALDSPLEWHTFHNHASSFRAVGSLWSTKFWRTTFWTNESPRYSPWMTYFFKLCL